MPHTILIVDDDVDTLKLIGTTLEQEGYGIHVASTGQKAIELAVLKSPDLIILDVMMPDMDGYEVLKRLRELPNAAEIPVILFTAKARVDDKVLGLEAGADDYLTKPTHPAELVARVKAILKRPKAPEKEAGSNPDEARRVIGLIAPKGGLGITMLAINLGVVLAQSHEGNVIVAEMRPGRGDMSLYLGHDPSPKMSELLRRSVGNLTRSLIDDALVKDKNGVQFLFSSYLPSDVDLLSATSQLEAITQFLKQQASLLILDLGVGLPAANKALLAHCDDVIVALESHRHSIKQVQALLKELSDLDIPREKIHPIILNRFRMDQALAINEVESMIGDKVAAVFTPAPELAHQAAEKQTPIVVFDPDSYTSNQVEKLAKQLTGAENN